MSEDTSPGVYVEGPSSVKPIAGVSTSTAAFIGALPDKFHLPAADPKNPGQAKWYEFIPKPPDVPVLITNWTEFTKAFGGLTADPGGTPTQHQAPALDQQQQLLAQAVFGFFNNGGSRCYVVPINDVANHAAALAALAKIDEIAIVLAPGIVDKGLREAVVTHCEDLRDRMAILDGERDLATLSEFRNSTYAALYFPWIQVSDPTANLVPPPRSPPPQPRAGGVIEVPPSGHVAGIYARVDSQRGVHKAPANEPVRGALQVTQPLGKTDQGELNRKGVNCIRVINGDILVWGARTIGGDANADLKYVNVRRTLLFLEKSIEQGTQWVVFEPNTPGLWQKTARNVTAFLTSVWRSGALFGTTPQEAFYVKCDAETNPPALRDLEVVTEVGVAIARPAEFVIFRISQESAPTAAA